MENILADSLARWLRVKLQIFDFQSRVSCPDTITFFLARQPESVQSLFFNVNLDVRISGDNVLDGQKRLVYGYRWPFAPNGSYDDYVGSKDSFIRASFNRIRIALAEDGFGLFVKKILSKRLISENKQHVRINFDSCKWILPFTFGELQIGPDSKVLIVQKHTQNVIRKYYATIIVEWKYNSRVVVQGRNPMDDTTTDTPAFQVPSTYQEFKGFRILSIDGASMTGIVQPLNAGL